jgi:uncharacterized protein DUF1565
VNRRDFVRRLVSGSLGLAAAAHTLDLERLLWVPGQLVAVPSNYGNTLITPEWVEREFFVSTSGNDANSGTALSPFKRVAHAVKQARVNDTIYVSSGTYLQ